MIDIFENLLTFVKICKHFLILTKIAATTSFFPTLWKTNMENPILYIGKKKTKKKMRVFNMSTVYEHIKQNSRSPFTL